MLRYMYAMLALALGLNLAVAEAKLYALNHTGGTPGLPTPTSPGSFRLLTIEVAKLRDHPLTSAPVGKETECLPWKEAGCIPWTPGSSTVDHDHGILYFIGSTSYYGQNTTLVGVSLKTGAVVSSAAIPFSGPTFELFAADLVYASDLGEVLLLVTQRVTATNLKQILGTIHPATGEWKTLTTVSAADVTKVDQQHMAYVPGKQICIFQLGVDKVLTQFAYDFKGGGGNLKNATTAQFTDMVYNPRDGMIWGHGVTTTAGKGNKQYYVRELSKLNPSTLVVTTVKTLKTLATDGGALATLDVDSQTMYWISALFTDDGSGANGPFYLVGVSLDDGSIVSQSLACKLWNNPWSPGDCPDTLSWF